MEITVEYTLTSCERAEREIHVYMEMAKIPQDAKPLESWRLNHISLPQLTKRSAYSYQFIKCQPWPEYMLDLFCGIPIQLGHGHDVLHISTGFKVGRMNGVFAANPSTMEGATEISEWLHKYMAKYPNDMSYVLLCNVDGGAFERMIDAIRGRCGEKSSWTWWEGLLPSIQEFHKRGCLLHVIRNGGPNSTSFIPATSTL